MYLRKMGSVSLLTREGEVEIAKRIEDGERRVLQVVLNSSVAIEEILELGDKLRKQKIRVKEVVKDADEEDAEFDEQWHIERVCKVIDKVRRLFKEQEKLEEKLDDKGLARPARRSGSSRSRDLRQEIVDALQEMRLNKKQIDKIVLKLKDVRQAHRAGRTARSSTASTSAGMSLREFRKTLREIRTSPLRQRAVGQEAAVSAPKRSRTCRESSRRRRRRSRRSRRRLKLTRGRPARHRARDPRRRAHGRARQGRARRGQPPPRRLDREEVHEPRPAVPRPDPGGQHRPHEGGRQVRVQARLQVLDVRDVVDPPGDHARDRRPGAHDPHPGPHDRDDQQADPHQRATWCRSSAASRRRKRSPRRWSCRSTRCARS